MASVSVLTTDAAGETNLSWFDSIGAAIGLIRNFRAANDYADNTENPACIDVSRDNCRVMFWSPSCGLTYFAGRS